MHVPGKSAFNVVFFKFSGLSISVWLTIPPRAKIILYCSIVALKMHKKGMSPATKNLSLGFSQNVFKPFFKLISGNWTLIWNNEYKVSFLIRFFLISQNWQCQFHLDWVLSLSHRLFLFYFEVQCHNAMRCILLGWHVGNHKVEPHDCLWWKNKKVRPISICFVYVVLSVSQCTETLKSLSNSWMSRNPWPSKNFTECCGVDWHMSPKTYIYWKVFKICQKGAAKVCFAPALNVKYLRNILEVCIAYLKSYSHNSGIPSSRTHISHHISHYTIFAYL